jgi:hypothetical protein
MSEKKTIDAVEPERIETLGGHDDGPAEQLRRLPGAPRMADELQRACKRLGAAPLTQPLTQEKLGEVTRLVCDPKITEALHPDEILRTSEASDPRAAGAVRNALNHLRTEFLAKRAALSQRYGPYRPKPQTIHSVAALMERKVKVSKRTLEELERLIAEDQALLTREAEYSQAAASAKYKEQQRQISRGTDPDALTHVQTKETIELEFRGKKLAIRNLRRELAKKIARLKREIAAEFNAGAQELADRIDESDRVECAKFEVPWQPSPLALTVRAAGFFAVTEIEAIPTSADVLAQIRPLITPEKK